MITSDTEMLIVPEINLELQDTEWQLTYTDHDTMSAREPACLHDWRTANVDHEAQLRDRLIARAIVYDDAGTYYFVRAVRDDDFGKATLIETSGGGVELGEDLTTAIRRELKEELGAEVRIMCKIGVVSDYYNLIHRHNINHYFLCKISTFGEKNLTKDEIEEFHLSTLKMSYEEAVEEYKKCADTKIGRLVANRELPILERARKIINSI